MGKPPGEAWGDEWGDEPEGDPVDALERQVLRDEAAVAVFAALIGLETTWGEARVKRCAERAWEAAGALVTSRPRGG